MATLKGVLPVVHTPLDATEAIDFVSLERQIDWAFQHDIQGVCTGMVSELLRLTPRERRRLTEAIVSATDRRGAVVIGVGAESTRQAVEFAEHAADAGADAVMAIPPISSAVEPRQLGQYFRAIADRIEIPLIVQDASGYVGQEIPLPLCVELLEHYGPEKILFKPEASPIGPKLSQLRDATAGEARIFEGSGGMFLIDSYRRGIAGTIPGMEFLAGVVEVWNALQRGDEARAYQVYFPLCALVALQLQAGLDGFLAIEKYLMVQRGLFETDRRRTPYQWNLDEETRLEVDRLLEWLDRALEGITS